MVAVYLFLMLLTIVLTGFAVAESRLAEDSHNQNFRED